jgi:hypothetical protein
LPYSDKSGLIKNQLRKFLDRKNESIKGYLTALISSYLKVGNYVEVKTTLDIIANKESLIALSLLLIFRIERFMQEIVLA